MKKTVIKLAILLASIAALPAGAQLRYGIHLGGSIARSSLSNAPTGYSVKGGSGFSGGLSLEYQLNSAQWLAFDVSALYTRYSYRMSTPLLTDAAMRRNFIEVPVHVKLKYWMNAFHQLVAPMIYTGPSLMWNLGSGSQPLATRRMNPGWDLGIGIDAANILQLQAGYRFCLSDALRSHDSDMDLQLRGWHVSATLFFDF